MTTNPKKPKFDLPGMEKAMHDCMASPYYPGGIVDLPIKQAGESAQGLNKRWGYTFEISGKTVDKALTMVGMPGPQEINEAVRRIGERVLKGVFEGNRGDSYTTADFDQTALTEESFNEVIYRLAKAIEAMPIVATEIWFVDCRDRYDHFKRYIMGELGAKEANLTNDPYSSQVMGIRIVEWYKRYYDPETEVIVPAGVDLQQAEKVQPGLKRYWPWVCCCPGAYVKYSNGTWAALVYAKGEYYVAKLGLNG